MASPAYCVDPAGWIIGTGHHRHVGVIIRGCTVTNLRGISFGNVRGSIPSWFGVCNDPHNAMAYMNRGARLRYPEPPASSGRQCGHSSCELFPHIHAGSQPSSLRSLRKPHSQRTSTRHPASRSRRVFRASRSMLASNLVCQCLVLLAGVAVRRQFGCLCQKQPWTKITSWYLGSTISGLPGRSLTLIRNRNPCACRYLRTFNSGRVFLPRMPDIIRERVFVSTISILL